MDPIKEALKKAKKGESVKPIVVPPPGVLTDKKDLVLSDNLLIEYFMSHLDKEKVKSYLLKPDAEIRKKLVLVDLYAAQNSQKELYSFIEEPIHLLSWTAFLSKSLEKRLAQFSFKLFGEPLIGKPFQEKIAEDALSKYLDFDFGTYQNKARIQEENLFVLINNLLRISPAYKDLNDLGNKLNTKMQQVDELFKNYNVDINKGLDSLYIINGIKQLKS